MKGIIRFSVEKAITVLMVVIAVMIFGVVSFNRLTSDLFPDINIPYAVVVTPYSGAAPEEVEQEVSIPLEQTFQTTTNVTQVETTSSENMSMVMLEFTEDADMDSIMVEMRENMNTMTDSLPDDAGTPSIIRLNPDMLPIMNFSVSKEGEDLESLSNWVDDELSPRLERIPGVGTLNIMGAYDSEVRITLDEEAIDDYNNDINDAIDTLNNSPEFSDDPIDPDDFTIDEDQIGNILEAQNVSFPAGYVDVDGVDYLVRVGDDLQDLDELRELTVFQAEMLGIDPISVDDVAEVDYAAENDEMYSRVNGRDAISLSIQKGSEYATTEVANDVNAELAAIAEEEDGFEYTTLLDQGEYIEQANQSVLQNLLIGGLLAILILLLFLRNLRVTFIVGVAIPVSLLAAVILIYLSDITLNIVSLGGLALGIGMLVDNSIVVIENIFRMKRDGASNKKAAINGSHQVAGAIIASTLTTVSVFVPIMFIEGFVREIFYQLALTITFSLVASLVIALTFVPTVANRIMKEANKADDKATATSKIQNLYERILLGAFKFKYLIIVLVIGLMGVTFILATARGFQFFPPSDEGSLQATIESNSDEPVDYDTFTNDLDEIYDSIQDDSDIDSIGINLGGGGQEAMLGFSDMSSDTSSATMNIVLSDDRDRSTTEVRDDLMTYFEESYPDYEVDIQGTEMDTQALVGEGISVRVKGSDLDTLRDEAQTIGDRMRDVEGISEVDDGFDRQEEEIKVSVDKEEAIKRGLTVGQVLQAVSEELSAPSEVTDMTMDGHTYSVFIYQEGESERREEPSLDEFETLEVGTDMLTGQPIELSEIADVEFEQGFGSIERIDGTRYIDVSAELESGYSSTLVAEDIESMLDDHDKQSGYSYDIEGESEEIMATIDELVIMGALGILLVYMIMASQFQSLLYPFIIMLTIPLAFTGGFGILYVSGYQVSIVAIIGLIILSGVVVNNGIVLVDYINQLRQRGYELKAAIIRAGRIRLRPIFMTALTTILALMPLALGYGEGAELMQPMALTAIGGLVYATFLTIFVVPIFYDMMTRHGRIIFGSIVVAVSLGLAIYYGFQGQWLYVGGALGLLILTVLLVIFLPANDQGVNRDDSPSKNDDDIDSFLKRTM
ncbi:MAG: efflux RND transporter permease subunit [Bacillota bacterium]